MRCNILFMFIVVLLAWSQIADADPGPMVLFYNSAATYQSDATSNAALPIGNGKLAAMVYGGMSTDIIQFNEDTVWAGHPHDYSHAGAADYLQQIQDEVWDGDSDGAWAVADDTFMSVGGGASGSDNRRLCPYEPTAELRLSFGHSGSNYRRQLDLTTATASVTYTAGGVTYQRDCFASYPDNVIVVRLTASESGSISFTCSLTTPHTVLSNSASGNDVVLHGAVDHVGRNALASDIEFESRVRILNEGGSVAIVGNSLQVSGADAVTLVLGAASNYVSYDDISADESAICLQTVGDAAAKGYTALRQDQLNDYQPLFNRVTLDLGTSSKVNNPTDQRIDDIEAGVDDVKNNHGDDWAYFTADDLQFIALNFQMARYLLISGSRPGSQPLGLQGKWNNEIEPSWEGKMTLNINEEMNYWGAEVANLGECQEPLIDMTEDLSESGATVASVHYGADGWVVHHNTDLWRGAAPINGADGLWTTGGAWLSMHLWWHYEYSQDTTYLTEVYPLMKGAAEFFVDFLVEDPDSTLGYAGYLLTNPSYSPEHDNPSLGAIVAGSMIDNQLVRCLFTYVIEASEILGVDATFRRQLETMRAQLPPNMIGQYGQLQEWIQDVDRVNDTHRHMSHLVDLMPAGNITPIHTPELADAAEVVLDWKGDATNNTSWSQAWKMCCRTHLLQGDHAYMILNKIFGKSHTYNMTFSRKGGDASITSENQIDGNLGVLMGTAEMFLQSDQGEVFLLPALPSKIAAGSVTGLRARGGFEVDITWADNELQTAQIQSLAGNTCRVRSAWPITVTEGAQSVSVQTPGTDLYEFATEAGHTYTLTAGGIEDLIAPDPDPMEWDIFPTALDGSTITMTAATATDTSGVEYYFENETDGSHDSGWQDSNIYTDTGLLPNTSYTYNVRAQDKSPAQNETAASSSESATTGAPPDLTPPTPDPMTWADEPTTIDTQSITMTATVATDTNGVEYYFENETDGSHDSGWQDSNIYTDTGLLPNTSYTYNVRARDKSPAQNETGLSSSESATTDADTTPPTPNPMTFASAPAAASSSSITMTATTATDDLSGVEYYFDCLTAGGHDSGWQSSTIYVDTDLLPETSYSYQVKARDTSDGFNETAPSSALSATTLSEPELGEPSAYWPFDETSGTAVHDISGAPALEGALQGSPLPSWTAGKYGNCVSFNDSSQRVYVPSSSAIDFGTESFSVSMWAKQPETYIGQYELLIKGTIGSGDFPGTGKRYELYRKNSEFRFAIDDDVTKSEIRVGTSGICTGEWVHIAAVRNTEQDQLELYIDGSPADTLADGTGNISQTEPLYAAHDMGSGAIDDLRIYPYVLSSTEVADIYLGAGVAEYTCTAPISSDLDGNCQVNIDDFAILADAWIDGGGGTGYDLDNLAQLAMDWLECNRDPLSECWQ